MKKLYIIIIITLFVLPLKSFGQQNPMYTQYMFNPFVLNPAIAGTFNYYQVRTGHRFQWIGFPGGPVTNVISVYGPFEKQPMGIGGVFYSDILGTTSTIGAKATYAYNYTVSPQYKISGGLSIGFLQFQFDASDVQLHEEGDILQGQVYSQVRPDANFGLYFYSSIFHVGFAADQVVRPTLDFEERSDSASAFSRLKTHFYITSGYKYMINREWAVEPTLILKKNGPAPFQLDFSVRGIYANMVWLGVSGRTKEGIAVLFGYTYNDRIYIGYSYDVTLNSIKQYSGGSHEFMVGYKFGAIKK